MKSHNVDLEKTYKAKSYNEEHYIYMRERKRERKKERKKEREAGHGSSLSVKL
uniref:Uncharacterized protein n=1 Tax=Nelumbo nucifera TaxID=4432 RepID=A0A822YZ13_NELNU|nr:TPA_asm: hypothetical protein HUJ06_013657 [Nelumbo nucifera]